MLTKCKWFKWYNKLPYCRHTETLKFKTQIITIDWMGLLFEIIHSSHWILLKLFEFIIVMAVSGQVGLLTLVNFHCKQRYLWLFPCLLVMNKVIFASVRLFLLICVLCCSHFWYSWGLPFKFYHKYKAFSFYNCKLLFLDVFPSNPEINMALSMIRCINLIW